MHRMCGAAAATREAGFAHMLDSRIVRIILQNTRKRTFHTTPVQLGLIDDQNLLDSRAYVLDYIPN